MSKKNKKEESKIDKISHQITDALSSLNKEELFRNESCPSCPIYNFDISEMLDESKKNKEEEYKIGNYLVKKTLGQGTFGKVKLGIYLPTQEKVAIKILEKDRIIEKDDEIRVKREFDMLASFNHPNVILVAEIFESTSSFYSVMEYCAGGELFNFIVKNKRLSEEESAFFYYQLICGLEYIHSLGIVHRDLKPENLLLTKDHVLKIIDFGLSNYFKEGQEDLLVTPCGSPCYASPEMVAGNKYNGFKIDIWSTGIILYAMLCGYLPFEDKDNDILFEKILECKLDFPKYISETSKDLIEKILVTDPSKRIDIPQIKEHPFFIKGKEIFEQEFSVCQIKREDNEANDENANLNNILKDIEKELDEGKEENEIKNEEKNDNKQNDIKVEENDNEYSDHKKIKEDLQTLNLEQENIKRLNTEYEERRPYLNSNELETLDKNENNKVKTKTNSSMKKYINRKIKIKNKTKEKEKEKKKKNEGPFKRRDIVFLKNDLDNKKNRILNNKIKLDKSIKSRNSKNNKKLIKTSKYNNIKKRLNILKKGGGKSAYLRSNNNYLNNYKNMLSKRINFINIIKNQFNSKENLKRKLKRKENIYNNNININNTIDNRSSKYKQNMNFDFKFYNSSMGIPKKNRSVDKKNIKLFSFETTYNKKYLENLFNISSNIKKYEKNLNSGGIYRNQNVNDNEKIKNKILGKNKNNSVENSMLNNFKKEKAKIPYNISRNNNPGNINIIDNTKDSDINIIENININNIKNNTGKNNPNQITPKNKNKMNEIKDKNPKKIKLKKTNNANINKINQDNVKFNYYLNEIDKKKTLEIESIKNDKKNKTSINSANKKKKHLKLRSMIIHDFNKKISHNKIDKLKKENTQFRNKQKLILESNAFNSNIYNTIDNFLKTEPDNQGIKRKLLKKENPKYSYKGTKNKQFIYKKISTTNQSLIKNRNKKIKKQNNFISNYSKKLNKTSHNFNVHNTSKRNFNQNNKTISELTNVSPKKNINRNVFKKINNPYAKKSQVITSNLNKKNQFVTIKNTVINFNIDTGFILASIDKKRNSKKNNPKNNIYNSVNSLNNKKLYDLAVKYNNHFITNNAIGNINHSNTNENFPVKKKMINTNNTCNSLSLNEDLDLNKKFDIIKKNNNYQKIYIYDDNKSREKKNIKLNYIKDEKNDNKKINNKSVNYRNKGHNKFRSMKLDDFYGIKGRKKDSKNIYIYTNEN